MGVLANESLCCLLQLYFYFTQVQVISWVFYMCFSGYMNQQFSLKFFPGQESPTVSICLFVCLEMSMCDVVPYVWIMQGAYYWKSPNLSGRQR